MRPELERYRRALPEREYAALDAWLSTFWPFQVPWILDQTRYSVACKSRQIGLSHSTAAVGVLWGAFHGELTTIISIGDREAVEVLDKAKKHARVLQGLGCKMAQLRASNTNEMVFASGGRILALPSSGGRSFTGNVFLDEFAYQQHAKKVWDAAAAVTLLAGRLRVASTPNGVGNEFHGLWSDPTQHKGWSRHEISIQRAIADGFPVDMDVCWKLAKGDPRIFAQLFECSFLDNEFQYIPTDLVTDAKTSDLYTAEGEYYAGLDIGRTVDLTVLVVVRKVGELRIVQHIESCKRTDSDRLRQMVADAFDRFSLRRLCVDATGMGAFPADDMRKAHGRMRVVPITFGLASKETMATGMYTGFSKRTVRIPVDDAALTTPRLSGSTPGAAEQLALDICAIRRKVTRAGNVVYEAPQTDKGHADHAWALALALLGTDVPSMRKHVISDGEDAETELS